MLFIQNTHSHEGRKQPKFDGKSFNFLLNTCIGVGSFTMSFGSKILSGSWVTSLQSEKYKKIKTLTAQKEIPRILFVRLLMDVAAFLVGWIDEIQTLEPLKHFKRGAVSVLKKRVFLKSAKSQPNWLKTKGWSDLIPFGLFLGQNGVKKAGKRQDGAH